MAKVELTPEEKELKAAEAASKANVDPKDAEIEALKAQLEESKTKEVGADLRVAGAYKASNGKKYGFKDGHLKVRMKGGLITESAALIEEANKKDGDPLAKATMEHLVELNYIYLQEVK